MARIPKERRVDPIGYTPITDSDGRPTSFFARQWQNLIDLVRSVIELQDDSESNAKRITDIEDTNITAGVGLTGGGRIGDGDMTIDADVQALLDGISNTHGSVLFRGALAWQALGPGTVDYVLATKGAGADPEWVVQSGGGGGGGSAWEVINAVTISSPVSSLDFTNLGGYEDFLLIFSGVTASVSSSRSVRVSTDNGSSFFNTSGDYQSVSTAGVVSNLTGIIITSTGTTARSGAVHIPAPNLSAAARVAYTNAGEFLFLASSDPIDALRFNTGSEAGTLNAGTVILLGRKL